MKIDLNGNKKYKVKVIKTRRKQVEKVKPIFRLELDAQSKKPISNNSKKAAGKKKQNFFEEIEEKIKEKYRSAELSIYFFSDGDFNTLQKKPIYGKEIHYRKIEKYMSFGNPTLLVNPSAVGYKNRFVTRFENQNDLYLVVISSHMIEAFDGKNDAEILLKIVRDFSLEKVKCLNLFQN